MTFSPAPTLWILASSSAFSRQFLLELLVEDSRPLLFILCLAGDEVISYSMQESFFHRRPLLKRSRTCM
jgi:hypothetical protein